MTVRLNHRWIVCIALPYCMYCSLPIRPIFVAPSRCADAITAATSLYGTSLLGRRWISAWTGSAATCASLDSSDARSGTGAQFQVVVPSKSISICTTSGCVIGGGGLPIGMFILMACVWIGIVMISMISNTSITSISGVVLISTITSGSALPPPDDTFIPIIVLLAAARRRLSNKRNLGDTGALALGNDPADEFITRALVTPNVHFRLRCLDRYGLQACQQRRSIHLLLVPEEIAVAVDRNDNTFGRGLQRLDRLLRQLHRDRVRHHRNRDQKDDQQDQHHIDERRGVDTGDDLVVIILPNAHSHDVLRLLGQRCFACRGARRAPATGDQDRVQLCAERTNTLHHRLVATNQEVVAEYRRHSHGETDRGHDQRFTHRARDLVDRSLAGNPDCCQRVINPPHSTEQTDERRCRADCAEESQAVLQTIRYVGDGAINRGVDPRVAVDGFEQCFVVMFARFDGCFRDEAERRSFVEQLRACDQRRRGPQLLVGALRTAVGTELLEELGDHDVPATHRHEHQQNQHEACNKVTVLPERAEAVWVVDGFGRGRGRRRYRFVRGRAGRLRCGGGGRCSRRGRVASLRVGHVRCHKGIHRGYGEQQGCRQCGESTLFHACSKFISTTSKPRLINRYRYRTASGVQFRLNKNGTCTRTAWPWETHVNCLTALKAARSSEESSADLATRSFVIWPCASTTNSISTSPVTLFSCASFG